MAQLATRFLVKGKIKSGLKKPNSNQDWWMVLNDIDEQIGKYYRHLYHLDSYKSKKLAKNYWGSHVTIVRNEIPPNIEKWFSYHNEEVEFKIISSVKDNYSPERYRSFYWLNVQCSRFDDIREELGLPPNPDRTYHMTIGSVENRKNKEKYEAMWAKDF